MSPSVRIVALVALSVAQLAAAGWSIARYESVLRSGTTYRIETIPIDPADAFRGRYVAVRPLIALLKPIAPETEALLQQMQSGTPGYVVLTTGDDGFARVARVLTEPPDQGDYLKVARVWQRWNQNERPGGGRSFVGYNIDFSFDRYYMNEAAAPAAQDRYAGAARRSGASRTWLAVRVKDGAGVIEGLLIDGVPIEEVIAAPPR